MPNLIGFANVIVTASGGNTVADLTDSTTHATFTEIAPSTGQLAGPGSSVTDTGFKTVRIHYTQGVDHLLQAAIDYIFAKDGNWQ